jgi:flagellar hook-basal body complex protein FliE
MKMLPVNPFIPLGPIKVTEQKPVQSSGADFAGVLKRTLGEVNELQVKADEAATSLVLGEAADIHQVMIAVEQAKLSMQMTVQIRNKFIEAYQEISRMQI